MKMGLNNKEIKEVLKPGTTGGMVFYTALFFLLGLLLVTVGFWKMLLVALFTLVGLLVGASGNLRGDIGAVVNKVVPPKNQKVVYTQEDIDMLKALRKEKESAAETKNEEEQ